MATDPEIIASLQRSLKHLEEDRQQEIDNLKEMTKAINHLVTNTNLVLEVMKAVVEIVKAERMIL